MASLSGKKIAFVATNGFEDSELTQPWEAVTAQGAEAVLIAPESGSIAGKKGHEQPVDLVTADARPDDYDGMVLPGGVVNGDKLRMDQPAVAFVREIFAQHKPVGVICHGGWILISTDLVRGKTITSWPSLADDMRNAGADWVDKEVVVDGKLISSRKPDDLEAFNRALVSELGGS